MLENIAYVSVGFATTLLALEAVGTSQPAKLKTNQ